MATLGSSEKTKDKPASLEEIVMRQAEGIKLLREKITDLEYQLMEDPDEYN